MMLMLQGQREKHEKTCQNLFVSFIQGTVDLTKAGRPILSSVVTTTDSTEVRSSF